MQKPDKWIFLFANSLHWYPEVEKKLQTAVLGDIFIYVQIKQYIIPVVPVAQSV
jgi:hypothetical protein